MLKKLAYTGKIIMLLCVQLSSQSQDFLFAREVKNQFDTKEKAIWLNYYSGFRSDGKASMITLAHNGKEYKGILHIPSLLEKWRLEGSYHDSIVQLAVIDSLENFIGTIDGQTQKDFLFVKFITREKNIGFLYELKKSEKENFILHNCPQSIWYKSFEADLNGEKLIIQLQKESDHTLYGNVSIINKNKFFSLKGACMDAHCKRIKLNVFDVQMQKKREWIFETSVSAEQLPMWTIADSRENVTASLKPTFETRILCMNIQQGLWQYYAEYLFLNDRSFDNWINDKLQYWSDISKSAFVASQLKAPFETKIRMDIDLVNDEWVCGHFVLYDIVKDSTAYESFIFDRRDNQLLQWKDVFLKDIDFNNFFNHWINTEKKSLVKNQAENFRKFILQDSFDRVSMCSEGIVFLSAENATYGTRRLIMPFEHLKAHVKKNGPLKRWM